jgi:leucyl aminopeptidase
VKTYGGLTIEIEDTDAEGRVILADALAYMKKNFEPDVMIDLATLTGAGVVALGYHAASMFTQNDALAAQLSQAGEQTSERVWRLPLWDDYDKYIKSDMADVKNLGGRPGGAITAAKFLEKFTDKHEAWVHLDIAGVAFNDSPFSNARSATAYGVRLLVQYIESLL